MNLPPKPLAESTRRSRENLLRNLLRQHPEACLTESIAAFAARSCLAAQPAGEFRREALAAMGLPPEPRHARVRVRRPRRVPAHTMELSTALDLLGFDPLSPKPFRSGARLAAQAQAVAQDVVADGSPCTGLELLEDSAAALAHAAQRFWAAAATLRRLAPGSAVHGDHNQVAGRDLTAQG